MAKNPVEAELERVHGIVARCGVALAMMLVQKKIKPSNLRDALASVAEAHLQMEALVKNVLGK